MLQKYLPVIINVLFPYKEALDVSSSFTFKPCGVDACQDVPLTPPHPSASFLISSQIMLLTDPEVESSLLISLDEGASYQKHGLAFDILSLLFHPEQEDWILAYSHDQKVIPRWQMLGEKRQE